MLQGSVRNTGAESEILCVIPREELNENCEGNDFFML